MSFTTQTFLFGFFPICVALYNIYIYIYNLKKKPLIDDFSNSHRHTVNKELLLIFFSLLFYAWAGLDDVFRFVIYIIAVYLAALWIERTGKMGYALTVACENSEEKQNRKLNIAVIPLAIALICLVVWLVHFKYLDLLTAVWNFVMKDSVESNSIIPLLGISFVTFSAISYLVDIYRGNATAGSLIDCAFYLLFFPKVVSGPIVLWKDFQPQIKNLNISLDKSVDGINRIMIGFAKKLLLADQFGACIAGMSQSGLDLVSAWGSALLYMLQIYYDFSGYSDIAIGISKMFGFDFKENFNFPYLSKSISEFWRRWHISLGTWFREYVYFPLGGSRAGKRRTIFNIAVVFALTGIWHGAGLNYLLWGAINGICNIIERLIADKKFYIKTPAFVKWLATMAVTFFCWQLFRFEDFADIKFLAKCMLGLADEIGTPYSWQYYFDVHIICITVIGILGSTVFGFEKVRAFAKRFTETKAGYIVYEAVLLLLFVISVLFMVNSTYSPFIYFQY